MIIIIVIIIIIMHSGHLLARGRHSLPPVLRGSHTMSLFFTGAD